ncbi:hypothetical protein [Thermoanaerobacterium thermosaccharolyticum]|uniref:hypothetical protein n=1 Tax=Thermoanaerobacterium thermosaccharolyticum TaxID=1517 RepID=UPI0012DC2D22|nr:hypothetical protein [Thermoanaerobacterium thermosaccharolyticum]
MHLLYGNICYQFFSSIDLNTDNIRSAGIKKAKIFALLNCITLVAGTIAVNVNKSLPKVA